MDLQKDMIINNTDLQEIECKVKFVKKFSIHMNCKGCNIQFVDNIEGIDFCTNCKEGIVWIVSDIERI